jgi:DNA-binding NtrC family response regulator
MTRLGPIGLPDGDAVEHRPRVCDRRAGLTTLLAQVASALQQCARPSDLRGTFEAAIHRLVPGEARLLPGTGGVTPARVSTPNRLVLPVPTSDPARPAALELAVRPGRQLDDWDLQVLGAASLIAALVIEIERRRGTSPRAEPLSSRAPDGAAPIIGSSAVMRDLRARMERIAATDFTVLIEGESGTGKELVARQIHELSRRRQGVFVAVNCAAVVETLLEAELFGIEDRTATGVRGRIGKFEHAEGGTLFLDEISDLSLSAQAKLLRILQDLTVQRVGSQASRRVDCRIIAATNRSLAGLVERRLFRQDLFYRLSGVELHVPSLRERREDVRELSDYFLQRHRQTRPLTLSDAAADALGAYEWPGNVRELERLIERSVALAEQPSIGVDDLPVHLRSGYSEVLAPSVERHDTLRAWGSRYVRLVLDRSGGNKRRACRTLDISYHTLQAYLEYAAGCRPKTCDGGLWAEAGDAPEVAPDEPGGSASVVAWQAGSAD